MFARHILFLFIFVGILLAGISLLNNYLSSANLRLSGPTLLVLQLGRWLARSWYYSFILMPLYYVFLVAIHSADQKIIGIRRAWFMIFWTIVALFTAALAFGFVLPFL